MYIIPSYLHKSPCFGRKKNKPPEFTGGFQDKNLIKKKINIVAIMARPKTFILSSRDIPILYHSDYKKVYVLAEIIIH